MRCLAICLVFCFSLVTNASVVLNAQTGELYVPIVKMGDEYYEVNLQQRDELTFEATRIIAAGREALRAVRRGLSNDVYDPATGLLSLSSVQVGTDVYQLSLAQQGNMVFSVVSANLLESNDAGSGTGRDRGTTNPPYSSGTVTAVLTAAADGLGEVNLPYVRIGKEYYEVDLQQVNDVTFEIKTVSDPLRLRSEPRAFNTYDPAADRVVLPGVQIGSEVYEVTMLHQGNLVFRVTSATPVADDASDNVDNGGSDLSRGDRRR